MFKVMLQRSQNHCCAVRPFIMSCYQGAGIAQGFQPHPYLSIPYRWMVSPAVRQTVGLNRSDARCRTPCVRNHFVHEPLICRMQRLPPHGSCLFHAVLSPLLSRYITKSNVGKSFSAQPTCRANSHHSPCSAVDGTVDCGAASMMLGAFVVVVVVVGGDGFPSADGALATATVAPIAIKLTKLAMIRFNNVFS